MRFLIDWVRTVVFLPVFIGILVAFHLPLMVARAISFEAQRKTLECMNLCIITALAWIMKTRFEVHWEAVPPGDRPLIVVANHQSMYDIPLFVWYFRFFQPQFIAKKELAKGIPSISYALRTMFLVIDRENPLEAVEALEKFGEKIQKDRTSAILFPEGTRARDGKLRRFKSRGFIALCKTVPDAVVVPVVISNSWRLVENGLLPVPSGVTVSFTILPSKELSTGPVKTLQEVEEEIRRSLNESAK